MALKTSSTRGLCRGQRKHICRWSSQFFPQQHSWRHFWTHFLLTSPALGFHGSANDLAARHKGRLSQGSLVHVPVFALTIPSGTVQIEIPNAIGQLSLEANSSSTNYIIPRIMYNPKDHSSVNNALPFIPTMSQMNPVHAFHSCYFKTSTECQNLAVHGAGAQSPKCHCRWWTPMTLGEFCLPLLQFSCHHHRTNPPSH